MKIVPLRQGFHDRNSFVSGLEELDTYLKKYALQDVKRNLTKVFVLSGENSEEILGYYTLSPLSFSKKDMKPEVSQKLPSYPIPAILLGRLAVNIHHQKKGMGTFLLMDALWRVYQVSQESFGIYAIVVDAKNDAASSFYKNFGFTPFFNKNNRLLLPLESVKALIS